LDHVNQPGLTNAGLADQQDDLAAAFLDLFPAVEQETHFPIAPDKRCEPSGPGDFDATESLLLPHHAVDLNLPGDAAQGVASHAFALEETLDQAEGGGADKYLTILGQILQPASDRTWLSHDRKRFLHRAP